MAGLLYEAKELEVGGWGVLVVVGGLDTHHAVEKVRQPLDHEVPIDVVMHASVHRRGLVLSDLGVRSNVKDLDVCLLHEDLDRTKALQDFLVLRTD